MEVAKDIRKNGFEALPTDIVIDSTVTNNHEFPTSVEEPVDPVMYLFIFLNPDDAIDWFSRF